MIYIHQLNQLNPKSAEVESVYLIRELKQKTPYPLQEENTQNYCADLFVSLTDKEMVDHAFFLIPSTVESIQALLARNDSLHEPINLQRAIAILNELPAPLQNNSAFVDGVLSWQHRFVPEIIPLLNGMPKLQAQERSSSLRQLNGYFEKLLRNNMDLKFNSSDIINEATLAHINGLSESMGKGVFFHVSLEEELKKVGYEFIKQRIPAAKIEEVEHIRGNIEVIKRGVERAYSANMRMMQLAIVLYSYVKWLGTKGMVMG